MSDSTQQSRFGLNLFTQLLIIVALSFLANANLGVVSVVLGMVSTIIGLTFSFGLLYGFFRLLGVRSEGLESFYQSFPFGMAKNGGGRGFGADAVKSMAKETSKPRTPPVLEQARAPINWSKIFSFQFLRFVGLLLIITAVFALLFKIEWQLIHKIIASSVAGVLLFAGAEWLKTKKAEVSPFLAIIGFAMLQFALTLLFQYAGQQSWQGVLALADTWMYLKIALSFVLVFSMTRYSSPWYPLLYVFIAYFSATSLQYVGANFSPTASAIFIVTMSALTLASAFNVKRYELILTNVILANIYLGYLLYPQAVSVRYVFLGVLVAIFVAQLFASVLASAQSKAHDVTLLANTFLAHAFVMLGLTAIRPLFPLINTYIGVSFLVVANITIVAYLLANKLKANGTFTDVLFNTAVIIASIGLFIQVDGQWSAVVFLAYATAVLWFSLYRRNIRTRIYGSILLLVSLFKLYTEFSDIFDHIWGSVAILVIGLLLVALSYKFEAMKDVMLHGMHHEPEKATK